MNALLRYSQAFLSAMQFLKLDNIKQMYTILEAWKTFDDGSSCF